MVDKNENSPKRRSRLFAGFRSHKAQPAVPVVPEPEQPAPSAVGAAREAAPASAADTAVPQEATAVPNDNTTSATEQVEGQAAEAVVDVETIERDEADQTPVVPTVDKPALASPFEAPLTTTSLIFHAPDIAPLPEQDDYDDEGSSSRRRSRQRPGGSPGQGSGSHQGDGDEPSTTRTRSRANREPREPREVELITEPQRVKGSTRLEAKKQRRRDGRDAGRRRPVVTEAEFLARRESVDRKMIVRTQGDSIQIGVLEDGILAEHYVAKSQNVSLIGNVYLGRVQNVLPSMEAAFVDIGRGRNAVLYSGEVDWDSVDHSQGQPRRIELALKPGDRVLVQVTKDPVGHKGARLTSQISLPGRFLVYVPNGSMNGISRKLPDTERARLKKILKEALPENTGVIVRTAAEGATEEQLTLDVKRLLNQWADISKKVEAGNAPTLLHSEPDLLIKIVRDVFNEDFHELVIDGDEAKETIEQYLSAVAPDLLDRVKSYEGDKDSFDEYRLSEQIDKALDRKVWLPSGGSLVIDRTEAMTVVDVNTGKFVGSGGNLEETVTKNNIEAAEELVRQLRLRDIGGIIVVDFIDMVLESNRDLVLRRLVECLSRDRTKHQVAEVTSLGLVQMTRKKLGLGLAESFEEIGVDRQQAAEQQQQNRQKSQERRRAKAANGNGAGNGSGSSNGNGSNGRGGSPRGSEAHPATGTIHAITDDVKNALAKIAASTVPHAEGEPASPAETAAAVEAAIDAVAAGMGGTEPAAPAAASVSTDGPAAASVSTDGPAAASVSADGAAVEGEQTPASGRSRRGRGRRASASGQAAAEAPASGEGAAVIEVASTTSVESATAGASDPAPVSSAPAASASAAPETAAPAAAADKPEKASRRSQATVTQPEATVAILDIPVAKVERAPRKVSARDAEQLLDSVLGALPEPKQPGQGRSRSRRASTSGTTAASSVDASASGDSGASGASGSSSTAGSSSSSAESGPFILGVGVSSDDL
ncbi:Rne/Rng family ribonuclease [Frondihabitans sp. PAMC 28766]|uniref:Rne/Rng family ribonuclease n=1 Tax=Frondihabitans sp. PAMC 28766 TaxID=1795630 RepID=UPI0009E73BE0|nr:Rne/Rng family ribonuclease [Frondihabitans sp. PAMC 28766]